MQRSVALALAMASLAASQNTITQDTPDTDPRPITPESTTTPTSLPLIPISSVSDSLPGNATYTSLETTTATATATAVACIPETDLVFSIQTDTNLPTATQITPVCGQDATTTMTMTTESATGFVTTAGLANGTTAVVVNGTAFVTSGVSATGPVTLTDTVIGGASATRGSSGAGAGSPSQSGAASASQSGSPAEKVAVGGSLLGFLGAIAGLLVL